MATEFNGKYLSLTTFRRDETGVATPMWFVRENGHLLVETDGDSYKAKRIRRNSAVTVAECTASGKLMGERVAGHAEFLPETERSRVEALIAQKYRMDKVLVLPVYRLVQRLHGKKLAEETPVVLSITPD